MLTIQVNGQAQQVASGTTIAEVLRLAGVPSQFCAVELNLEILPRDQYDERLVQDGDVLEVVTLVGGG
jgi:sulfur carrier protein